MAQTDIHPSNHSYIKPLHQHGKLLVFTAPSGGGKSTIVRHLLQRYPQLAFSVSATTRPPRPHETNGVHYYFLTEAAFGAKRLADEFLEWEEVYEGLYYGTLWSEIERIWANDQHVVFDIEVNGAQRIKNAYPDRCLTVFIQPPDEETLFARLHNRQTESPERLRQRMDRAAYELSLADQFDTILINDDLQQALADAEQIVETYLGLSASSPTK